MLGILGGDDRCPIARSLDVLGEKWSLMIVRDCLAGSTRFSQLQASLGVPREVLTARLASLVEGGVLERHTYKPETGRSREEYLLTEAGRDLTVVLMALGDWADRHRPSEREVLLRFVDEAGGEPLGVAAVNPDGHIVPRERIRAELRPSERA